MTVLPTKLPGVHRIDFPRFEDERGYFMRAFCAETFAAAGLPVDYPQSNLSHTRHRGTVRGLHFQTGAPPEYKLVRVVRGRIFDVVVDLRPDSPSFRRWAGFALSAADGAALFVPGGCAHGFQTLEDDCTLHYMMGAAYAADRQDGVRFDDPRLGIDWPLPPAFVSARDRELPGLTP